MTTTMTQERSAAATGEHVPRVSIGLPVYNGEEYVARAIESMLAQDFEDFELIISDNGSTDGTEAICRAFAARDARIRYLRESENRGAAWNFSRLPGLARAEYFRWQCHDDEAEPTLLSTLVAALDGAPKEVILAFTGTQFIDEDGQLVRHEREVLDTTGFSAYRRYAHLAKHISWVNTLYGLFRRDAVLRTHGLRTYANADYVLFGELSLVGQFMEVPGFLFKRRIHSGMSRRANVTAESVAVWFDTSKRGRQFYWSEMRLLRDQLVAIMTMPVGPLDRLLSLYVIPRYWMRRRWRYIGRELLAPLTLRFRRYAT